MSSKDAVAKLKSLALANLDDLFKILKWNNDHGIKLFRITSNLFPHIGDWMLAKEDFPRVGYFKGDIEFAREKLKTIGDYARQNGIRLTFHSNPYCHLSALDPVVLRNTLFDIMIYTKIFHMMGIKDGCLILHGGGIYGDKKASMERLEYVLKKLPAAQRAIIALENDERFYSPNDLLPLCEKLNIPFCFDVFHNSISADSVKLTKDLLIRICKTWGSRIPKFHLSEQSKGDRFGAHSLFVKEIPSWMFHIAKLVGLKFVDLMIECKAKELAVLKLIKKYTPKTIP